MKSLLEESGTMKFARRNERGQVVVLFAVGIAVIVSFIVVAISPTTGTASPAASALSLQSLAVQDGSILESTEISGVGGFINATTNSFRLGDDASKRQYRAILSFNTSSLPDDAIITSVVLKIRQSGSVVGSNPINTFGNLVVDLRKGTFGATALEATDFSALATRERVGVFDSTGVNGWYTAALNSAARNNLNRTGLTQLRLRFALDDNNNLQADYIKISSGDAAAEYRPVLQISYLLPTTTPTITLTPTITPTPTPTRHCLGIRECGWLFSTISDKVTATAIPYSTFIPRSRKLLLITKTLLNAIAPAASIGLR